MRCLPTVLVLSSCVVSCRAKERTHASDRNTECGECALVDDLGDGVFYRLESPSRRDEGPDGGDAAGDAPAVLHVYRRRDGLCCPSEERTLPAGATLWLEDATAHALYLRQIDARWSPVGATGLDATTTSIVRVDLAQGGSTEVAARVASSYECALGARTRLALFVRSDKRDGESFGAGEFHLEVVELSTGRPPRVLPVAAVPQYLSLHPDARHDAGERRALSRLVRWSPDCNTFYWHEAFDSPVEHAFVVP